MRRLGLLAVLIGAAGCRPDPASQEVLVTTPAAPTARRLPPIDRAVPPRIETATFALG